MKAVVSLVVCVALALTALVVVTARSAAAVDATSCLTPEGDAWTLTVDQRRNAQLIIDVGRQRNVPPRGWAIAVATSAQEASLLDDDTPDQFGSSGLFQQTPPSWGTREEVNDPTYAANAFYTALLKVSGWQTMPLTVAAQTVQISAFPDAYAKHTATAINAVRDLGGIELDCAKVTTGAGTAKPAPRNPDGSWPTEGCTIRPDPVGAGCSTPRLVHANQQAIAAGYPKPGNCFRPSGPGEHPKGRACDYMMTPGGEATGAQKQRGDALAAWAVANAEQIALMYVIWFRRIWTPSKGWHAYNNPWGGNDPSGWHTNHIHISVY